MAASDALPVPRKNVAWRMYFALRKNDGTLITSWSGADTEISKDGGSFADCTNEATEIGTSGCGYIDLTSSEMNADNVIIKTTVTNTDALPLVTVVFPEEAGDYRADVVQISGDSTAADNLEAACDGTGYNIGGGSVVAASVTGAVGSISGTITSLDSLNSQLNSDHGSGSWATATGFSTHSAADVWAVATRELTSGAAPSAADIWSYGTRELTNYTAPDSASTIADAVWDEALSGHTTAGTAGKTLSDAGAAGDPWATSLPGAYSAGSAGYIVGTNLNATVSSRSNHSAADVWSVATRVLTAGTNIVLAKGVGVTGFNDLSAAQVNTECDTALSDVGLTGTVTGRIDAAISTRLASASYTAPLDAAGTRAAVGLTSANLDTQLAAIVADTGELQADWADGGRLDVILDARASQSTLTTVAGYLDTEIAAILEDTGTTLPAQIAALAVPLDAAGTRAALGLAAANLDTQLSTIDAAADAIKAKTDNLPASPAAVGSEMALIDGALTAAKIATDALAAAKLASDACAKIADIVLRRTMANVEASSNGDSPSLSSLYGAVQQAQEVSVSGGTMTIKQTDGSTTLGTKTVTTTSGADPIRGVS